MIKKSPAMKYVEFTEKNSACAGIGRFSSEGKWKLIEMSVRSPVSSFTKQLRVFLFLETTKKTAEKLQGMM